jgi:ATP-binding cassette, subfamily B, multidrug efflux pump
VFRRLHHAVDPFRSPDLSTPPSRVWPFLLRELRPLRSVIAASIVLSAVGSGIEVWLIGYTGRLVDSLAAGSPDGFWRAHGGELVAAAALVLVARPLVALFNEGLDDIAFRPNAETLVRWRAHRYVVQQSVGWFRRDLAGRIATWVRDGGTAASSAAYSVIHTLSAVAFYIVGSAVLMASIDPRLVIPLAVWVGLYGLLMAYVVPRYSRATARLQAANSELTGHLVDGYANIDTLKLFADESAEHRAGRRVFGATRDAYVGVQRVEVTMNSTMNLLGGVLLVGLIGYGIVLWSSGAAPLGLVAAALALSFRITSMAEWLLDAVSSLFGSVGALRQAIGTIAQPLAIADRPGAAELVVRGGAIRLTGISHHYGKGSGGLDRLSLEIGPGEKVGLVGRSGAGKSTLVNLILRFYEAESGTIEIDGQDITTVTQQSLRRRIAMVTQEATLLHRSIRDNIAAGRTADAGIEAADAAIEAAARHAVADGFIAGLRDHAGRNGYDAHAGERGVLLSGGQRQRIALARAIHKNAPILILDEATAALDSEVEAAIRDTLDDLMDGRTVIAIAHRLSTVTRMDRIVVLDRGRIVEQGSHADLLAQGGLYAGLWARQSGGFLGLDVGPLLATG